jgi:hypothetical protein
MSCFLLSTLLQGGELFDHILDKGRLLEQPARVFTWFCADNTNSMSDLLLDVPKTTIHAGVRAV